MKRFIIVALLVVIVIGLTGCDTFLPYGRRYKIFTQKNTEWISEDETMTIHVGENGSGILTRYLDEEKYEYYLLGLYSTMTAYDSDGRVTEEWGVFYHRNWFSIKVYNSDCFEEGTKIKFYRVDE